MHVTSGMFGQFHSDFMYIFYSDVVFERVASYLNRNIIIDYRARNLLYTYRYKANRVS